MDVNYGANFCARAVKSMNETSLYFSPVLMVSTASGEKLLTLLEIKKAPHENDKFTQ